MARTLAVWASDGLSVTFYRDDVHDPDQIPSAAEPISEEVWLAFLAGGQRWNGAALDPYTPPPAPPIVPPSISDRQFAQVLALDGVITKAEAKAWAARGDLPVRLEEVLLEIPEEGDQRFAAEMLLSSATTYERAHPLVPTLGALLGYDASALDAIWTRGAAL